MRDFLLCSSNMQEGRMNQQYQELRDVESFVALLKDRFEKHRHLHEGVEWLAVEARLKENPRVLQVLHNMETTGGEPDVIEHDAVTDTFLFCDCSAESPAGRRNLCYDDAALRARKVNRPAGDAMTMAKELGITMLSEDAYRFLQSKGSFDTKTSSWIKTPDDIRRLGGAVFCDRRYNYVFAYHNGAESYYSSRGFRGSIRV